MVLRARQKREIKMKRRPENVEENFSCPLCGIRLRCRRADSSVFTVNILPRHNKEVLYKHKRCSPLGFDKHRSTDGLPCMENRG